MRERRRVFIAYVLSFSFSLSLLLSLSLFALSSLVHSVTFLKELLKDVFDVFSFLCFFFFYSETGST